MTSFGMLSAYRPFCCAGCDTGHGATRGAPLADLCGGAQQSPFLKNDWNSRFDRTKIITIGTAVGERNG
jgi:hypothetical protein